MRQFTLYENLNSVTKGTYPYFVGVQSDLLDSLGTRVVIPLTPKNSLGSTVIANLCPMVSFDGEQFVLLTHQMTNVPISALKNPVGSLGDLRTEIVAAIDFLVAGIRTVFMQDRCCFWVALLLVRP